MKLLYLNVILTIIAVCLIYLAFTVKGLVRIEEEKSNSLSILVKEKGIKQYGPPSISRVIISGWELERGIPVELTGVRLSGGFVPVGPAIGSGTGKPIPFATYPVLGPIH